MNDLEMIDRCLKAVAYGPFIPEWEFHTLFGLTREEVKKVADEWPNVDMKSPDVQLAVNNTLANLGGYPVNNPDEWGKFIPIPREQIFNLLKSWRARHMNAKQE